MISGKQLMDFKAKYGEFGEIIRVFKKSFKVLCYCKGNAC